MGSNFIHGKEQVEEITKVWEKLTRQIASTVDVLEQYKTTTSKLPSDYLNSVNQIKTAQENQNKAAQKATETTTKYVAIKKEEERLNKLIARRNAQNDKSLQELSKRYHILNEQKKAADKLNREEAKRLTQTQGLYARVQAGINSLTKKYNDLAVRKELNGKLSAEEVVELGKLEAKLTKYQNVLKRVDANIGKHQRNVGNYKSSFDGLGFSVAQLTREMPAFANSMQTGFMAISNNIPMLVDEINRLKVANQQLTASGKPTVSIMKSLGKALFSWQTLISVGVTLLTVFGAKIFDTIFAISEEEKALKKANEEIENQNKALKDNIQIRKRQLQGTRDFINNKTGLEEFQKIINNVTDNSKEAEAVLSELSDRLDKIGVGNADILKNQDILTSDRLRIANNLLEIEDQNIKLQEERARIDAVTIQKNKIIKQFQDGEISAATKKLKLDKLESTSLTKTIAIQKEKARLIEVNNQIIGKTVEIEKENQKATKETEQYTANSEKAFRKQIATLTELRENTEAGSAAWHIYDNLITLTEDSLKALTGQLDKAKTKLGEVAYEVPDFQNNMESAIKTIEALRDRTDDFISSAKFGILKDAGLTSLQTFFDGTLKNLIKGADTLEEKFAVVFTSITDVAKEAYGKISQFGQENFNAEYDRLAKQKEVALQFAGESTAAREQVEQQYEEKRAAIQTRQAKAEKEQAKFKIAIDTAQAIVASVAKSPLTFGLPFSAFAAAIGALQLGIVSSQKIPQFWMGTEGTPGGQIMVNDDPFGVKGSNYKEVVKEPSGKLHFPQGKNVKMRVPKGSTVYPTYTDFGKELNEMLSHEPLLQIKDVVEHSPVVEVKNNGATAKEIDKIMEKHLSAMATHNIAFDKSGFKSFITKGANKLNDLNNRVNFKGKSV